MVAKSMKDLINELKNKNPSQAQPAPMTQQGVQETDEEYIDDGYEDQQMQQAQPAPIQYQQQPVPVQTRPVPMPIHNPHHVQNPPVQQMQQYQPIQQPQSPEVDIVREEIGILFNEGVYRRELLASLQQINENLTKISDAMEVFKKFLEN